MNDKEFLNSLRDIDKGLVQEAAEYKKAPRLKTAWIATAAAGVLALIAGGALLIGGIKHKDRDSDKEALAAPTIEATESAEAPTNVPTETANNGSGTSSSSHAGSGDKIEPQGDEVYGYPNIDYTVLNGVYYEKIMESDDLSLMGAEVGEVTEYVHIYRYYGYVGGFIDEGGNFDPNGPDFREHTGNLIGKIYAVRDYPTEYLLCQKDGRHLRIYFSLYRLRYFHGRDILEAAFGVSERFAGLEYMREQRYDSTIQEYTQFYEPIDPELYGDRIEAFIDALDNAEYVQDMPEYADGLHSKDDRVGFLRIMLNDGMYVNVVLYEHGYAWIYDIDQLMRTGGVLKLDNEAAEGIAELVRGKLVFTEYPERIVYDFEDAISDPWLGSATPKRIPEGFKVTGVNLMKYSVYELDHSSDLPDMDKDAPTKYLFVYMHPEDDDKIFDIHIDVFNRDDERCFEDFAGVFNEFIPIEEFDSSKIMEYLNDPDYPMYGALLRVGEVSVKITVTAAKEDAAKAKQILMELVDSING